MRKLLWLLILLGPLAARAQNTLHVIIRDDATKLPLPGATALIAAINKGASADTGGRLTINNIPNGKYEVRFSFISYSAREKMITFPQSKPGDVLEIYLEHTPGELAEVVIQTTRTNQNLSDIPTRIEALAADELDEKGTMRPGDIKMLLGETTGIHVQATSAVSGTANFRLQGLDSRYTQLLKDGMPLYQGFSGGLSLMQISPLDLKQVEFIKGSASTLYGGGAIAGLINLISKTPQKDPELTVMLNGTSGKGADASAFYAQKWMHVGTTVFTSYNYNGAYDPSGTGFSAIPKTNRFTLNPKLFVNIDDKNSGWMGVNGTYEDRMGGDMQVIGGNASADHQYFERNLSYRFSSQLSFTHKIDTLNELNLKNAVGYFDRTLSRAGYTFKGLQTSSYSELNYVHKGLRNNWVAGMNVLTDDLSAPDVSYLNYHINTYGLFVQNTYKANGWLAIESGLRLDDNSPAPQRSNNGLFWVPRVNMLFAINKHWSSRIGGGLGYKMPSLFNDDSEEQGYQYIKPLNIGSTRAERSYGGNADITYKGALGDAFLSVNQLFFYTRVNDPLILDNNAFVNAPGYLNTRGTETNVKIIMDELGIYLGYTYNNTERNVNGDQFKQTLTPAHQLNADVTYEIENSFRAGIEGFFTSSQLLSDGSTGRAYFTFGALVQKMWKHLDIFINAENLTDQRQSKWGAIYSGPATAPMFKDVYAPLEGVIVNAGIRIKLLSR